MDTQPFESMTTRDPAKLQLIGVVSWYQFQPAFLCPHRITVSTPPFHGVDRSSILRGGTNFTNRSL